MPTPHSTEWWFVQSNAEVAGCYVPAWENVLDGVHVVYALGNDGMYVTLLVYLNRMFRAARMAEAAGRPAGGAFGL